MDDVDATRGGTMRLLSRRWTMSKRLELVNLILSLANS